MMKYLRDESEKWEDMFLEDIKWVGGYKLRYKFADGKIMEYDIYDYAVENKKLFQPMLDNPEIVKDFKRDGKTYIFWNDLMDFSSEFLYCIGTIVKEY